MEWTQISEQTVCVVPMYNEAQVVGSVLDSLKMRFPHILCVDDGSTDASAEIARARGVRVITHRLNIGQGAALQTAFRIVASEAQFRYLVTFDADGQHDPDDAVRMAIKLANSSASIMFATRFHQDAKSKIPIAKQIVLRTVVRYNKFATGVNLSDTHNGLRAIRAEALPLLQINHFGMAHATEIVSRTLQGKLEYLEAPATINYTEYSMRKGQSIMNAFNILLEHLWR
jgi:glycosyltransferase involved in cell wall biosynthesis